VREMRQLTRRSALVLAAKVAGAVGLVALIAVVRPFVHARQPSSQSNLDTYVSGFQQPVDVSAAPGEPDRLYVVEQPGRIRYVVGRHIAGTFLDIRGRVKSGGEQGLLSVAFSPQYATDHRFYVDYTDRNGDTRVVEFRSRHGRAVLASARQLLFIHQPYANHNGGQLQFGPDGLLYVGMGDGGAEGDPQNRAENLHDLLGKLLRADPKPAHPHWQIVGYGLRNPWRFSFDRATGDLYIGDVGQNTWEEIDFRPRAKLSRLANYGWRIYEGRTRYAAGKPTGPGELVWPIAVYSHSHGCSVTGGYVHRGRYFYGDFCSGTIWSLRVRDGRATDVRKEKARIGQLSSFGEDAAGNLYAVSLASGRLYRVGG
jgi:glucose/arabinose dehydrogenase